MSAFAKTHLKAARECISKKDYSNAKKHAGKVLDFEAENYNAHVFLGLALLELGEYDESEQIYRKATNLNPTQPLAWQGLASFYEKRENWDKQADVLVTLLELFSKSQDVIKCAETLQKLILLRRKHGTPSQLIDALGYYLPESNVYPVLSTLPPPDPTNPTGSTTFDAQVSIHNGFRVLQEILFISEAQEEDTFKREVEKRRTRLGAASPEQIRKDVFFELCSKSQLPSLYDAILNHPATSDESRVDIESKQLRYKQRYLSAIPSKKENKALKQRISTELDELVDAIVLLRKTDELGWALYFEGKDCEAMSGYDRAAVRDYIRLFPNSSLATLFKGYFAYKQEILWTDEEEQQTYNLTDDPLDAVLNASLDLSVTILGNRLVAEIHLDEEDYENAMKTSKRGLQSLQKLEVDTGKSLQKTRTALQVIVATSLVHFFPPKHHQEATGILDEVLEFSPQNPAALLGRAFVLQAASNWENAAETFDKVADLLGDETTSGLRAREESAWCRCQLGRYEEALHELEQVQGLLDDIDDEAFNSDRARCLWRIGKCKLDADISNTEAAYKLFISALKKDPEFAPAFTSLGIYYLEHASPPDPVRSSKCFQKAFELDARETEAARRLAEGFANDKEWDLVEVVAQRTIDGEGGLNAGLDKSELDATIKYLPTNAWAWKAIGVVKFLYKDYAGAIQAFQTCLRVNPADQSLWVRLGEAYTKAGRHAAALKALNHALALNPDDWMCSYFIAEVNHDMGLFEDAISNLNGIYKNHPDEAGPVVLLGQSHLDLGISELADGFQVRAEQSFLSTIDIALGVIKRMTGFRTIAWKMIGDAASHLSTFSIFTNEQAIRRSLLEIRYLPPPDWADKVLKVVGMPSLEEPESLSPRTVLVAAIHSYLSQISLLSPNQSSIPSAWYDLGIALQSWLLQSTQPVGDETFIKEKVIEYFKKALQADAGNDVYWVALGNVYFLPHAKAAQHAYIKALEIDSKSSATWVNLGLLYFHHGDVELANEALYRAQVLDPDNTLAWVGQFLIARANNDTGDATLLLEHAVGLPTPVAEADYEFAYRVFEANKNQHHAHRQLDAVLPAFFMLNRYCQKRPKDASALHLLSLVCERLGQHSYGEKLAEQSISILETAYEETEDPEVEMRYTIGNCTLGRLRLSQGDFVGAAASFESALGLLADKDVNDGKILVLKVQVHLKLGLANFFQGNLEAALRFLEEGLQIANDDLSLRGQIVIVLAQTLWAIGTEETKESAQSRLLECIASDPENVTAINTLAGMGILAADDNLVDAALSEILALPIDQKHSLDPQRHVDYLLIQHHLAQNDRKKAISIAQHAVYSDPARLDQRNQLASLIVRGGGHKEGLSLLADAEAASSSANRMDDAEAITAALSIQASILASEAASGIGHESREASPYLRDALRKAQRAILMRPSEARGWRTLAYVRSHVV